MPEPLIPAHVDLRDFPFMPLDVARLRDSSIVDEVDGEEFRAAILLWCAAWHQVPAGSLPDEPRQLAKFAGYGRVVSEWEKVATGAMHGWVKCSDGRWYHPVVCEKAMEAWEKKSEFTDRSNSRQERARAAAEARWGKKDPGKGEGNSEEDDKPVDANDADASGKQCARMQDALLKGNRQGQGIDRDKEPLRGSRDPRARVYDEIEAWLRGLVVDAGDHPVIAAADVTPIRVLLDEPGITRPDVEAGIKAFLAKSRKKAWSWDNFENWIRKAARERIGSSGRAVADQSSDAPTPLPDLVEFRRVIIARCADHFRGKWKDVWPNAHRPDHPDCQLPEEIIDEARAIIAAEEASKSDPAEFARLRGFVLDPPRRRVQPVH